MKQLTTELATYKDDKNGNKVLHGGLLKEFTDKNYKLALTTGETIVNEALKTLTETKFPDFESFKQAREKTAAELDSKLQKSVAYPELSSRVMKQLEHLATKTGLQFDISAAEKEKEKIIAEAAKKKEIENEKENAELQQALLNKNQVQTNVHSESYVLREQCERAYRELKERYAMDMKMREKQIREQLKAGFNKRAAALQKELQQQQSLTVKMMMQMQQEANARQAQLTQTLIELESKSAPRAPAEDRRSQGRGLLSALLG